MKLLMAGGSRVMPRLVLLSHITMPASAAAKSVRTEEGGCIETHLRESFSRARK